MIFTFICRILPFQDKSVAAVYINKTAMFSIVIPVYNRPDEVDELLSSLCDQRYKQFEVVIVEDGSVRDCRTIVEKYRDRLTIHYIEKTNSGPGLSRNVGASEAQHDFLIFFDSDCIIPPGYLEEVTHFLAATPVDAYGGPDAAMPSFTTVQKAINYAMILPHHWSIRGRRKSLDRFCPRVQHGRYQGCLQRGRRLPRHAVRGGYRP